METSTIVGTSLSSYPRISFKKCVLYNHQNTINTLTFNRNQELLSNPTIKRCLEMHYKDERHKVISFLTAMVLIKLASKVVHMNRALALSAPRNWKSVMFKYVFLPYLCSSYKYVKDIKRTIMEIESQVDEDPQADELWQPIFQKRYPDLNQQLYSSPFTKFKIEDVIRKEDTARSVL